MGILNFVINEIFNQGAIFLALIACIGLILQKKSFSEKEIIFRNRSRYIDDSHRFLHSFLWYRIDHWKLN